MSTRSDSEGWDDLVSAALLGTDRRGLDAAAVLDRAALLTARRRGGLRPARAPAEAPGSPDPAAAETSPVAPRSALARLEHILATADRELLMEWLAAAASRGYVAPPALLPDLLEAAGPDTAAGAAVARVLGRRGAWLAGFRADWRALVHRHGGSPGAGGADAAGPAPPAAATTWELGEPGARRALLVALRRADPAAARDLLAGTWARESGPDREAFLPLLATGLSAADEPLLEAALDDRRRGVRAAAAAVLAGLPGSAYERRMAERAASFVTASRTGPRGGFDVSPPHERDEAMLRDGVGAVPGGGPGAHVLGERAGWLREIVAATPLDLWTRMLGTDPAGVLSADVAGGWRDVLVAGWADAATARRDAAWAVALLAHLTPVRQLDLFDVLPAPAREAAVTALLRARRDLPGDALLNQALAAAPGSWGRELSEAVLDWLARPQDPNAWYARPRLALAGHRLPPAAAPAVAAIVAAHPPEGPWRAAVAGVADLLAFRADLHEELR